MLGFRKSRERLKQNDGDLPSRLAGSYGISFSAIERLTRRFACLLVGAGLVIAGPVRASDAPVRIVVLGDSLSAGLGLPAADAFPAQLEKTLKDKGMNITINNAGVSGDTASGGLDRLDWSVPAGTQGVILELGANDALRGIDPKVTSAALDEILKRLKARNVAVLLCGMVAPPNYGDEYAAQFNAIFPDLAKKYDVPLYPFFLEGVAANAELNQADGMHPTTAGVTMIVRNILPTVEAFLDTLPAGKT
ncbi:MAG: arylesterase [Nitrobacter sp.]|nr:MULTISPECIES: arylesterase [unclassified Nitrobacter]MCB1392304.1 arylesterase [Nitrobacter sp.]MCV0385199.1 arylesterase [Nitrobacter sp.]